MLLKDLLKEMKGAGKVNAPDDDEAQMDAGFIAVDFTQKPGKILDDIASIVGVDISYDESGTAEILLVKKS